ncbi:alpha/beta hydrolase [Pseudoxanthomonas jiangsuensis]|uniref:alpha/beta fold hydrolase n=1 Tax=Pseudoxanthomonas jiangsuensis TaxID=619688 RepID=UPI0013916682|nr:alpha/beta hydrolase [Pseudoxanthomonas jiangsuensis]KAF1699503.1 alpha/beta hydrolase [Pseudoxanthomonas jiangsuensis]
MSVVPLSAIARPRGLAARLLLLACACLLLAGFTHSRARGLTDPASALGERLAAPGGVSPLLPGAKIDALLATIPTRSGHVLTPDGVSVFWRALDPGDYRMRYAWQGAQGGQRQRMDYTLSLQAPAYPIAARGTVILLHGWMMDGGSLLPWSVELAERGYRTIAVDLRNHGRSGAGPSGYGTREAADVVAVLRQLRAQGEVTGPLHVMGVSYGAATAIFTARDLGAQVDDLQLGGVVAMESFDNAGRAIRDMVPHMLQRAPDSLREWASAQWLRWRYDPHTLDAAIADADRRLALDLDRVDVGAALAQAPACVLLIHGRDDAHVPVAHGRALAAAAPRARYLELPGEDHLSLPMRLDRLAPVVEDWFARTPGNGGGACPQPLPPGRA